MQTKINVIPTQDSKISKLDFNNIPFGKVFTDHIFEVDFKDGEWQNARIHAMHDLELHPGLMALHYGQSIFEGMKASIADDGTPLLFRPDMHIERMNKSAERMCMPKIPEGLFDEALKSLVSIDKNWIPRQEGSSLYLRPFMFATDEFIGVRPSETYKFLILALPVGPYYDKPVKLLAARKFVRAVEGGVGEAKTAGNYAASLLPSKLAQEKGYNQVLWLDAHEFKYIQEVGTMNIFFVFNDKVITPSTDGAILKGITRDSIIHILKTKGVHVEERPISLKEVMDAKHNGELKEVFGSGTAAVVANVEEICDGSKSIHFNADNWILSKQLKTEISGIRSGKIEDPYGWVVRVNE